MLDLWCTPLANPGLQAYVRDGNRSWSPNPEIRSGCIEALGPDLRPGPVKPRSFCWGGRREPQPFPHSLLPLSPMGSEVAVAPQERGAPTPCPHRCMFAWRGWRVSFWGQGLRFFDRKRIYHCHSKVNEYRTQELTWHRSICIIATSLSKPVF